MWKLEELGQRDRIDGERSIFWESREKLVNQSGEKIRLGNRDEK